MSVTIDVFPCLSDNFGFLLHDSETGATGAIDAPDADAVSNALTKRDWKLTDILITHHHWDHTDGIALLKSRFGPKVTGPQNDANNIKGLDKTVTEGDRVNVGSIELEIIDTPGHTLGHIVYFDPKRKNLFSGDALFSLGCGRMFEGSPAPMWAGLKKLAELPDDTMVYCGHEYSQANAKFALSIDPENLELQKRAAEIAELRKNHIATIPFDLGQDKRANPFLRAQDPQLAKTMGKSAPADVFAAIRLAKDRY